MRTAQRAILLIAIAFSIHTPIASAQEQQANASLAGIVTGLGTGDPIASVRVSLISESVLASRGTSLQGPSVSALLQPDENIPVPTILTDNTGRFAFKGLSPGSYRLTFSRNGYVRQELGPSIIPGQGVAIALADGQAINNIAVRLTPTGSTSGTVRDTSGRPLAGALVRLMHYAYDSTGQKSTQVILSARTNDRGEYRLYYVTPGRYFLSAGKPVSSDRPAGGVVGAEVFGASPNEPNGLFTTEYYPGSVDPAKATSIDISSGAELEGINFSLEPQHVYSIRGSVVNSTTGRPPASANFFVTVRTAVDSNLPDSFQSFGTSATSFPRNAYNAATGTFELRDLPPGLYGLVVNLQGENVQAFTPVQIVNSDVENTRIVLTPNVSLTGQLRIDGQDLSNVPGFASRIRVQLQTSWNGAPITITNVFSLQMSLQANGTLRQDNVRPMEYRLKVTGLPPGFYVKQASLGETDLLRQPIRNMVSDTEGLSVVLASDSGRIDGLVTDGQLQPEEARQVALVPNQLRDRTDLYQSTITDSQGRFSISGIPPGDYKLLAWETIEPFAWFDPNLLSTFESAAVPVHVSPSSRQSISVVAISTSTR